MSVANLYELLQSWQHPNAWILYHEELNTAREGFIRLRDIEHSSQPDKSGEYLAEFKRVEKEFLIGVGEQWDSLVDIGDLIKEHVPHLFKYFPPYVPHADHYTPKERSEMVRTIIGELLVKWPGLRENTPHQSIEDLEEKLNPPGRPADEELTNKILAEFERQKAIDENATNVRLATRVGKSLNLKLSVDAILARRKRGLKRLNGGGTKRTEPTE